MSDLSPETNQLLELARDAGTLSATRRTQIKASLLTQIAAGGLAMQVGASSVGLGKAAWFSGPISKLVSAVALVSVAGAGVYAGVRAKASQAPPTQVASPASPHAPLARVSHASPSTTSEPAPELAAPEPAAPEAPEPAAPELAVSAAVPSPVANGKAAGASARPATTNAPAAPTSATANPDTLADETRLLRDADQALRAGNARRALSLLDEHAASYPHGALAPERNAERMVARCQLGEVDTNHAQAYLAAHPSSAFTARIRDACAAAR
ncbi:MAG TPA: hypothetical protein VGF76_19035 [Polyangiaceae bacterium]|jgi:hypothetical protein